MDKGLIQSQAAIKLTADEIQQYGGWYADLFDEDALDAVFKRTSFHLSSKHDG